MSTRLDADRWGDLEILAVAPLDLPADSFTTNASWWCGPLRRRPPACRWDVVTVRSHLGTTEQVACPRCAGIAKLRAAGVRPRRVLLIDDNAGYRDLLRRLLEDNAAAQVVGYVADGRQALVEIARPRPDTVKPSFRRESSDSCSRRSAVQQVGEQSSLPEAPRRRLHRPDPHERASP